MSKPLKRWLLVSGVISSAVFALAGTWRDPWSWAYITIWSATTLLRLVLDRRRSRRERFHPPTQGADAVALHVVRVVALSHLVVGALDWARVAHRARLAGTARFRVGRHGADVRHVLPGHARKPLLLVGRARAGRARASRSRQRSVQHRPASGLCGSHLGDALERPRARLMARGRHRPFDVCADSPPRVLRGCLPAEESGWVCRPTHTASGIA